MLKQLPIKKEYILIAATVVLLFLSYRLAFKHTIAAWRTNSRLKTRLAHAADASYQPGYLERKGKNLDKVIGSYKADTLGFRSNIISTISTIAERENVKLTEVPVQDVVYNTDHFIIEKLDFEGDYFSLSKAANNLQATSGIGVVRGETLKITRRNATNDVDKKLQLEIYLEVAK